MKSFKELYQTNPSNRWFDGEFGFEKENVRINQSGKMATTPHPQKLGNKLTHPYITTDFSESQLEMITPVLPSIKEALGFLETIHDIVSIHLPKDELLWPQSTPPELPDNDCEINIAQYGEGGKENEEYRDHLAHKYGRKKQLLSGIHFNFSFDEKTLKWLYQLTSSTIPFDNFKEEIYLTITRNFLKNRWFLITLLGNSPAFHNSYLKECIDVLPKASKDAHHFDNATSMRSSICGYKNKEDLILDYKSLDHYKSSLKEKVEQGEIINEKENYSPIRLKEVNGKLSYLEIRFLDLNPSVKYGIDIHHTQIIHAFLLYCLLKGNDELSQLNQKIANTNQEVAATKGMDGNAILQVDNEPIALEEAIQMLAKDILKILGDGFLNKYPEASEVFHHLLKNKEKRPANHTLRRIQNTNYIDWHLNKALVYKEESIQQSFKFYGKEDMELSTQLMLREAVLRGVKFDIMDRNENFVQFEKEGNTQYVMQATKTSLDNYSSILMMENKVMTKKLLEKANIRTPKGEQYSDNEIAKADYDFFKGQSVVIKPKSTNFGLGITIIKENNDEAFYHKAIDIAFEHDNSILVEEFVDGKEYRIFIIDDEVVGILHRVPANVKGDGKSSVRELVIEKNKDPLRGKGYKTPLEKIALGEAEEMFLSTQGYTFDTVPKKDEIIYLRENSNISTGGDSIDVTDDIKDSYKEIAVKAAKALDVKVTGLDMMIPHLDQDANDTNYAIIEMNFNPAIHIHCHPYIGKNRRLNSKMMDALGY
ncbi:bifunctional glutamate--cysteine ligase GshA/glutathione synthetase GshB [Flammeovirga pacifica]|uniref:Glutamate--cysteine ligase n=1 Tax=Flammeovirga pacifica TaxID=915059 RepID=A0A1S1YTV4_FLAPC|nr:bifunctional glutamate--cysteine ligase GshA/glutathione synthetase GshB [Flammeovirga pacifica]OHX64235.1 bifunctional glutamate--cysteine ligase/glutathione synthetase [Flammeovirga pacifica]